MVTDTPHSFCRVLDWISGERMAELKPCPFCGGEVEETGGSCNFGKKIMTLNVKCRKCGTSVALKTAWNTNAYLEAVEAWNRRVDNDLALSNA